MEKILMGKDCGNIMRCCLSLFILTTMICVLLSLTACDARKDEKLRTYSVLNPDLDFTLKDQDGRVFHLKDHRGKTVLLFFGYISCPDVCPVTLSKLSRAFHLLGKQADNVLTVFVTIDPERDTPEKMKEYLKYFKLKIVGLTGSKSEIDQVVNAYKGYYAKAETDSAAGYLMDHSDLVYLIDKAGRVVELIHFDDEAVKIAQLIRQNL